MFSFINEKYSSEFLVAAFRERRFEGERVARVPRTTLLETNRETTFAFASRWTREVRVPFDFEKRLRMRVQHMQSYDISLLFKSVFNYILVLKLVASFKLSTQVSFCLKLSMAGKIDR